MMTKEDIDLIKKTMKSTVFGLLFFIVVYIIALIVKNYYVVIGLVFTWVVLTHVIRIRWGGNNKPILKSMVKELLITTVIIIVVITLSQLFGGWGLMGFLLLCLILSIIILWRKRRFYMMWVEHIERRFIYDGLTATEAKKKKRGDKKSITP